ncbi:MAG TPA: FeoB-associated Cys-rich membrane protein [Oscillospiraceae bacterium]|nr:FeoB-associated Cys-rich membrane protein [Oscillospiraceae bacterium]HPK36607.1 FeoB-associated Cys-rich membrane protein [Oscillospiraceae bacterium]HPR76887.1 FeoB-associated Cys-rich membrane protein [Oscillospiraceae bacterium]HRY21870.1 FeoB-associated Cys-rich membrane protein [Flexilinea sp.]
MFFIWFFENLSSILIGLILAAVIALIIIMMIRNKKKGKSSCGCSSCSGCAMAGSCHPAEEKDKK